MFRIFLLAFLCFFHLQCFVFRSLDKPTQTIRLEAVDPSQVRFHWIGHATLLIQIYDKWILTDPNFSTNLGFVVKRYVEPAISPEMIPPLDAVVVSHSHFDHLDQPSLKSISIQGNLLVPKGAGTYVPSKWDENLKEMNPWDSVETRGIKITAVPARHFGGRWLVDNFWDGDPYTGYVIEYKDVTIYFAGDTGYQKEEFKEIGKRFKIDVALLPVGPSKGPNNAVHINPEEAARSYLDLYAKIMIPMHYGTFYRSLESELPEIKRALEPLGDKAVLLGVGETYTWKK
ncbi:MBL fold metallo-hydrolase [Leptospira idonii]|uniref:MBL fold metallo-hydrolase n=1 Tax=Leptospira idonii TaxID=1193500 RepID=A0A4R9M3E2_9LEPT|nr:MBL fold metallo-hydrolase [Leptospira idonii]TGN19318.1 MBL fold metallo-hydrolase [Leptospira idonii]